ncbi:hypothetical protein NEICINOT_03510 [Neisseria cinerea ATCC 14685]|uniref:Uncharacterized protein n=1 Tax=Neisseria cinerea ATCC 14685 TaxID=546262 RepID=D0W1I7_NEICI|nr:hypothetical protein NEICINOT_03510 [Neisseria cinerea ATCC 14685]
MSEPELFRRHKVAKRLKTVVECKADGYNPQHKFSGGRLKARFPAAL